MRFNRVRFHAKARSREVKTLVYFGLAVLETDPPPRVRARGPGFSMHMGFEKEMAAAHPRCKLLHIQGAAASLTLNSVQSLAFSTQLFPSSLHISRP